MNTSKLSSPTFVVTAAIIGGVALASTTCQGAVIDLFTEGAQTLSHLRTSRPDQNSDEVTLQNAVFPTRRLGLSYGAQSIVVSTSGYVAYQVDSAPNNWGFFELTYASVSPVNLLENGATALRLSFEGGRSESPVYVRLSINGARAYSARVHIREAPSFVDFPFSPIPDHGLDRVTSLSFEGIRVSAGTEFRLTSITTIPEPSPMILLSTTSLALLLRGR